MSTHSCNHLCGKDIRLHYAQKDFCDDFDSDEDKEGAVRKGLEQRIKDDTELLELL